MYFHVLEDGGYGDIGHQGVYDTKEEAQSRADKLADMFPNSSFYVEASDSKDEPYNVTMEENKEVKSNTKMKKSELKDKIKEMILKEMESNNMEDAPENEVDFLAELEGMLSEENGLTPLQDYVYQYEIEISGEDEAQEFLDDIKKLNTPDDVYDYYAYDRDWEGSMDDDLDSIFRQVSKKFKNVSEAKDKEEDTEEVTDDVTDGDETVDVTDDFSTEEPQGPGGIDVTQNANADLTGTKKEVQDNLEAALEAARTLGDEKLATQVGNTITFFNKQHVVKDTPVAEGKEMEEGYYGANTEVEDLAYALDYEGYDTFFQDNPGAVTAVLDWAASIPEFRAKMHIGGLLEAKKEDIKEILLLQKRAGIITETQYKQKLK